MMTTTTIDRSVNALIEILFEAILKLFSSHRVVQQGYGRIPKPCVLADASHPRAY